MRDALALDIPEEPLVDGGPYETKSLVIFGAKHILRQNELSLIRLRSVQCCDSDMFEDLGLPVSKTDPTVLG